ncbi:08477ba5-09da-42d4-b787-dc070ec835d9 [Sclerotinia trifoliorum]|uniref:08477ba5-09da-42d4-b787-dc070ec835d9 n=1 Tax=Sclerotinia trifoliorum TaxID=28548 RepID=A0A8H2W1F0_9HELO|nr:08477ba5-09da-42d4-b787-dc070ec835d9 [Sclerotinia trifoliorum]
MDHIPPGLDLCIFPAGLPPNGTTSNFENPKTLVPALISVCVIMSVVAIIFVACRLFANRKKMWWSDYFIIVAWILSLIETGLMLAQTKFARHQWDVKACWYNGTYNKIVFSQLMILSFVFFFSKASIFLLFHQIFEVKHGMRIAIQVGIGFAGLLYFTNIPLSALLAAPRVGETWTSVLFSDRPQKELVWGVVQAALGIVLDLFIFILPIPVILRLKLSRRKKIQILIVFSTALVGVIASVLSMVYRVEALNTNDVTWKYTLVLIFCLIENQIAIIVSCTVGFVNFVTVYISEVAIIRSLRSSLGSGNKSSTHFKLEPNQPRSGRGPRRNENHEFDLVSENLTSSTEMGEDRSLSSVCNFSAAEVSQETHYPEFKHVKDVKEFKLLEYPPRVINYGPSSAQPANSIWSRGAPSLRKQSVRPGNTSDHGHNTCQSGNLSPHNSAESLV